MAGDDPEREFLDKEQYENRESFQLELNALDDWARLIGIYKKDLGFIGFWENISKRHQRK